MRALTEKSRGKSDSGSGKSNSHQDFARARSYTANRVSPPRHLSGHQEPSADKIPAFASGEFAQTAGAIRPLPQGVQAKLAVGQSHDPLEREADQVADRVTHLPEKRSAGPGNSASNGKPGSTNGRRLQSRTAAITETRQSSGVVHQALRSGGESLHPGDRDYFESRFGTDFSQVQIHSNRQAAESARSFGALAFTVGSDIVFGPGQYQPGTSQGRKLLAHELTHVVQQSGGNAGTVSSAGSPLIQRFESYEHVQLGDTSGGSSTPYILLEAHTRDLPQHASPVSTWPTTWQTYYSTLNADQQRAITRGLSYGEVVALSGDMYQDFSALNRAPLREIIDLIPRIRSSTTTTEQFQSATGGRYLSLAQENISHFSNVPADQRNRDVWRNNHMQAIAAARTGNANEAWALNATGDHFLTDAFSGGHIRTDRATLHAQGTTGDIQSKILHDLDNEHGVDVTNARGNSWTAYGDDHLNDRADATNLAQVQEAVRLSKQDIADALARGAAYPVPTATTVFAAENLIPNAVSMTTDRWTGRQSNPLVPGTPWGAPNDYQRERRSLIGREVPGIASGLVNDDDQVRAWINRMDTGALGRQSEADKTRMIRVLLSGVVSSDDMDAIVRLLGSVTTEAEMQHLRRTFRPEVGHLEDLGNRARLTMALDRTP